MVNLLIDLHADVNIETHPDDEERTPLAGAAFRGHVEIVRLLCQKGARPDLGEPLHAATDSGHVAVVKALCDLGANVNSRHGGCYGNKSPLVLVLDNDQGFLANLEMVKALLNAGALQPSERARLILEELETTEYQQRA